jgi:diguanylate cyclase (GGDEF)-like protein/PAS domain S-box-containing protein
VHPEDTAQIRESMTTVLEGAASAEVEARLRTRHGDHRYWHIAMRRTSVGLDSELVAALRDVNAEVLARKAAETEASRRAALLNSMFDPHVVLQAIRDEAGTIVDFVYTEANDAACEYNQTPRDELVGSSLMQLLPGHEGTGLFDAYCNTVNTGEPLVLDDFVYPHEILAEPRRYDIRAVKVGDALSYTWRDVTERSLLTEQLAASEERFRLIATNTSDIICVADTHGILEWVSPSVDRALGWQPDRLQGRDIYEFVHPGDMDTVLRGQAEVATGREGAVRARVRDANGLYHWTEVRAAPILGADNAIMGITAAVSVIDDRVAWEEALRHQASHDPLTGLLTREEVYKRLASMLSHAPRTGIRTFLVFTDLDNLKATNDEFGHAAGDELLRTVAQRIRSMLRSGDQIARIGGDELLVILPGVQNDATALHLAHRLLAAVSAPHSFGGNILRPRMSIGLAEVRAGDDVEAAVHKADQAMYEAKAAGGNQVRLAH